MAEGIVVWPDGRVEKRDLDFPGIQAAVEGFVEEIYLPLHHSKGDVVTVCVNEDGLMKRMEPNRYANAVLAEAPQRRGFTVVGPAVFMGIMHTDDGLDYGPLSKETEKIIMNRIKKEANK